MIKVTAKVDETGTAVRVKELSGSVNDILDETASIAASIVGGILAQGAPEGIRPKEYEKFIVSELVKRTKDGVKQLIDGEVETTDREGIKCKGLVTPKKKTIRDIIEERRDGIDVQPEDEKRFLN